MLACLYATYVDCHNWTGWACFCRYGVIWVALVNSANLPLRYLRNWELNDLLLSKIFRSRSLHKLHLNEQRQKMSVRLFVCFEYQDSDKDMQSTYIWYHLLELVYEFSFCLAFPCIFYWYSFAILEWIIWKWKSTEFYSKIYDFRILKRLGCLFSLESIWNFILLIVILLWISFSSFIIDFWELGVRIQF